MSAIYVRATLLLGMGLLTAAPARLAGAEDAPAAAARREQAQRLFEHGKALYDAGNHAEACSALASSDALEPAVGTLGLLAACHERVGRLADAYREYAETARRAGATNDDRGPYAQKLAERLSEVVPFVTVRVAKAEPGLVVLLDGRPATPGEPLALDVGWHDLRASAPNREPWQSRFLIAARERKVVAVPALEAGRPAPVRAAAPPREGAPPSSTQRTLGWIGVGVGSVGLAAGVTAGVVALGKKRELETLTGCPADCPPEAEGEVGTYNAARQISTAGFVVAGTCAGAGLLLLLTAPAIDRPTASRAVAPWIGVASAGVAGRF